MTEAINNGQKVIEALGLTKKLARHRIAYKQMFLEACEKTKEYKAAKERAESRLEDAMYVEELMQGFVVDPILFEINGELEKDEAEVALYEKEHPQFFTNLQPSENKKKKKSKN